MCYGKRGREMKRKIVKLLLVVLLVVPTMSIHAEEYPVEAAKTDWIKK